MIVDTSAVVAILRNEVDAERFALALATYSPRTMSAGSLLESAIVIDANRDPVLSRRLDDLVRRVPLGIAPVTIEHVQIARRAYRDYGKGSGHPARLNLGDCFSYALARQTGEPLLFKGDDFSHTDLRSALE